MSRFIDVDDTRPVVLEPLGGIVDQVHLFDRREILAVNAALAAQRPLLVRGEPGTGKSQLARAAAKRLGRAFLPFVVDSQTEARDLQWQLDSLRRLAEAQLAGATKTDDPETVRDRLRIERFIRPGPLWWSFDWQSALDQAERSETQIPYLPDGGSAAEGCLVLIDEIDKAESEVPNGLLEALGSGQIRPVGCDAPVSAKEPLPLVIITTNEERVLPDPFLRRCLVLDLKLPSDDEVLIALLRARGKVHFPHADDAIVSRAATLLVNDRKIAKDRDWHPYPGQAEFLDLLRAVLAEYPGDTAAQGAAIGEISQFILQKHGDV